MSDLLIRADANSTIGNGHLVRCLALAQSWRATLGEVTFLGQCDNEALRRQVEEEGMLFVEIAKVHPDPEDLRATVARAHELSGSKGLGSAWVVLDGYHFDLAYQRGVKSSGCQVLMIDDTAHRIAYQADILLNQNIGSNQLNYDRRAIGRLLLGPDYAMLRKNFLPWRDFRREIPDVAHKILVTLGGADPDNITSRVIEALLILDLPGLEIIIVVGSSNRHYAELSAMVSGIEERRKTDSSLPALRLEYNVAEMAPLMVWADVAFAAGGSTCWELAYMGLPALIAVLANNQKEVANGLHEAQVVCNLGSSEQIDPPLIARELRKLCFDSKLRQLQSQNGQQLVDGRGSDRVTEAMRQIAKLAEVKLRPVQTEDAELLWQLANDPVVRENSFSHQPIPLADHLEWLEWKLQSSECRMWLGERRGEIAFQIRYEKLDSDIAEIHFAVAAAFRGQGLGTRALVDTRDLACEALGVGIIRGVVMRANPASARAFLKAGFHEVERLAIKEQPCSIFEWQRSQ